MEHALKVFRIVLLASAAAFFLAGTVAVVCFASREGELMNDCDSMVRAGALAEQQIGVSAQSANAILLDARPRVSLALLRIDSATGQLEKTSAGLNLAVMEINRPCGGDVPCGTLADVAKTLNTFRDTAGQVEIAANHEDQRLALVDAQEEQLADDSHSDLVKLGTAIDAITSLADNKDMAGSLAHLNTTSGALAGMATDTQQYWHSLLHPKIATRIYHAITGLGFDAAKLLGF